MSEYGKSFTVEDIENIIHTKKNTVVTYPAGTGKTLAIRDFIERYGKQRSISRVIYVAPTISLLDEMYERLVPLINFGDLNVFNYHSKSKDYLELKSKYSGKDLQEMVDRSIEECNVLLITHKRMLFEDTSRFLLRTTTLIESAFENKNTKIFIDEAVEPCMVAKIDYSQVKLWFITAGLIGYNHTIDSYKPGRYYDRLTNTYKLAPFDKEHYEDTVTRIYKAILTPPEGTNDIRNWKYYKPSTIHVELSDDCGFEYRDDQYDERIRRRLANLYTLIAIQLAKGEFEHTDGSCIVNLPVALQLAWDNAPGVQTIIMDATANYTKTLYKNYAFYGFDKWNYDKLNNIVFHHDVLTKSSLKNHLDAIPKILNSVPINKYNKIYLVSCKSFIPTILEYLHLKYSDYDIVYSRAESQLIVSDVDYNTDEDYKTQSEKVIYVSNYGRTRGSNIFRDCECVIQVGVYRLPVNVINLVRMVFRDLDDNDLPVANFIQELYRGKIRCDESMDTYSIIDEYLYQELIRRVPEFKMTDGNSLEFNGFIRDCYIETNRYGSHGEIIAKLFGMMNSGKSEVSTSELKEIVGSDRLDNVRRSLLRMFESGELKGIFDSYSYNEFEAALKLESRYSTDKYLKFG